MILINWYKEWKKERIKIVQLFRLQNEEEKFLMRNPFYSFSFSFLFWVWTWKKKSNCLNLKIFCFWLFVGFCGSFSAFFCTTLNYMIFVGDALELCVSLYKNKKKKTFTEIVLNSGHIYRNLGRFQGPWKIFKSLIFALRIEKVLEFPICVAKIRNFCVATY